MTKRSKLGEGQKRPAVYRKYNFRYPNPAWQVGDDNKDKFKNSSVSLDVSICVCAELAGVDVAQFVQDNAKDFVVEYNTSRAVTRLLLKSIVRNDLIPKNFDWADAESRLLAHSPSGKPKASTLPLAPVMKKDTRFDDF